MKIFSFLLLFTIVTSQEVISQKLYVWCPKDQEIKPRQGFLEKDTIHLIVFDGRVLPKQSKVECNSNDIISSISMVIKKAYPSATINILGDSGYYRDPVSGSIIIKIVVSAFHAGFGAAITVGIGSIGGNFSYGAIPKGEWNGITAYYVRLYDYRTGKNEKFTSSMGV